MFCCSSDLPAGDLLDLVDEVESLHNRSASSYTEKSPYQPVDPSRPLYKPGGTGKPLYQPVDTSRPSYQSSDPSRPLYQSSDASRLPYQPTSPSRPQYQHSSRVYKHFEPEPRPTTWNKQFETETETEHEHLSHSSSGAYTPREIEHLLHATEEFISHENNSKPSVHRQRDKGYRKSRISTKAKAERSYEDPSDVDAELQESRVLEDVFFVKWNCLLSELNTSLSWSHTKL